MDKSLLTYRLFDVYPDVKVFTTCRNTIAGDANPRFTGKPDESISSNREKLAFVLGIRAHQLVFPRQTHTIRVADVIGIPHDELHDTDALITNKPGVCLCIQTADCVPVLFYDPIKKVIAAAHAGWRGTAGLIVKEVIRQFTSRYQSSSENILVVIGPAISAEKYEVGKEVVAAIRKNIPDADSSIRKSDGEKQLLDLHEANKLVLLECGVLPRNIEISDRCTYTDQDLLFSARRDGIETGRMVSGIMLQ